MYDEWSAVGQHQKQAISTGYILVHHFAGHAPPASRSRTYPPRTNLADLQTDVATRQVECRRHCCTISLAACDNI